jgi:hypothetical protein
MEGTYGNETPTVGLYGNLLMLIITQTPPSRVINARISADLREQPVLGT